MLKQADEMRARPGVAAPTSQNQQHSIPTRRKSHKTKSCDPGAAILQGTVDEPVNVPMLPPRSTADLMKLQHAPPKSEKEVDPLEEPARFEVIDLGASSEMPSRGAEIRFPTVDSRIAEGFHGNEGFGSDSVDLSG
jgi:hypothetical protein